MLIIKKQNKEIQRVIFTKSPPYVKDPSDDPSEYEYSEEILDEDSIEDILRDVDTALSQCKPFVQLKKFFSRNNKRSKKLWKVIWEFAKKSWLLLSHDFFTQKNPSHEGFFTKIRMFT